MTGPKTLILGLSVVAMIALVLLLPGGERFTGGEGDEPLLVYCAAGMVKPVQAIAEQYEAEFGVKVQLELDGSGKLLSKIRLTPDRGHLYIAADRWYIDKGRADGLLAETIPIASMYPVIAVPPGNPKKISDASDLLREDVRLMLAHTGAAIGRISEQLLGEMGYWEKLASNPRVSFGGTVNEVASAVKLGTVDAGIVYDSLAKQFGLDLVEVDAFTAAKQEISIAVLQGIADESQVRRSLHFARYLTAADKGLPHFSQHHFTVMPDADHWEDSVTITLMSGAMLKPGIESAIARFEEREGVRVQTIYNGCGLLVSQMKTGTIPEAYFSCDLSYMQQVQEKFAMPVSVSRNPMVIATAPGNPKQITTLSDLADTQLRIGVAHPTNSALGARTEKLLHQHGLHEQVYAAGHRVVQTDAGHMLVNQLRVGSLDAIVVYLSNVMSVPNAEELFEVHRIELEGAVAEQPFAIARDAKHGQLLQRLRERLVEDATKQRFESIGFQWVHEAEVP